MPPQAKEPTGERRSPGPQRSAILILTDVQFWVPLAVLVGGLLVLTWIH